MRVVLTFTFESQAELVAWIKEHDGDLFEWMFAELCQNHGFGFLVDVQTLPDE